MTKKHFELIARTIKNSGLSEINRGKIAIDMARAMRETNPRFDMEKFGIACGLKGKALEAFIWTTDTMVAIGEAV